MGEVVVLGKELVILNKALEIVKKRRLADAYAWALVQQRRNGLSADFLRLTFKHGDQLNSKKDYIASIFYNPFTGEAILRQDWLKENVTHYDILVNFREISKVAPKSLEKLIKNGLAIAEFLRE